MAPEVGGVGVGAREGLVLELRLSTSMSAPAMGWGEHRSCSDVLRKTSRSLS